VAVVQRFDAAADEDPEFVLKLATYARQGLYLRDIPQVLLVLAANDDRFKDDSPESLIREWAPAIIQRMDETATALAVHDQLVGGFGDDFQTVSMHVDTPVLQRQNAVLAIDEDVGNATNGWTAIDYLRERGEPVERIVVFTDMQIWDNTPFTARDAQTVKASFDAYREEVSADTALYLVDLAAYGDLVTPEGYENVYNISGWTENVLTFIKHAEKPTQVIEEIDAVEPA